MKDKQVITYRLGDDFYDRLNSFADKILDDGLALFQSEFAQINNFYEKATQDISSRDDHEFRRSQKPLYLLEAIYFKILDNLNNEQFNKANDTVLILPQCLALMQDKCKRKRGKYGKKCGGCVPNCQINQIMKVSEKYGIEGYFSKRKLEQQLLRKR